MIEEIKLLIPLLQQAGHGTYWLIILFIIKDYLITLTGTIAATLVGLKIIKAVQHSSFTNVIGQTIDADFQYGQARKKFLMILHQNRDLFK